MTTAAPEKAQGTAALLSVPSQPHQLSAREVAQALEANIDSGLTSAQAGQRLAQFGPNQMERHRAKNPLVLFLEQFKSPLAWVLAVAAVLAFAFEETMEGMAIFVVILLNALIGFVMEWQAGRSMEALRQLAQTYTRVFRDGRLVQLPAAALVPGDIVFVEAGDMPAADMRLLSTANLGMNESSLTGESIVVSKHADPIPGDLPLADQKNMLFRATVVSRGNAKAIVVHTGQDTQIGRIAQLTQQATKEVTPLEKKLAVLSRRLIWLALVLGSLVLVIGLVQGRDLFLMIEMAIALAIAAIPEGLPVVATIALARGMLRLARQQVIVKKLSAVETLGETQVIITDKTGTLTENRLMPQNIRLASGSVDIHFHDYKMLVEQPGGASLLRTGAYAQLQKVAVLCNNAGMDGRGLENSSGDPLEVALLHLAAGNEEQVARLRSEYPRLLEIPFDSDTKMMGTLHRNGQQPNYLACIKGALEVVLRESDFILTDEGKTPITDAQRHHWIEQADALAAQGLRVLGFGYSETDTPAEDFFHRITFIGSVGFLDPPRPEVRAALEECKQAGLRVIMATGDHPATARNIGLQTGLIDAPDAPVMTGRELQILAQGSPAERQPISQVTIFARVNPAQKLDLVTLYQRQGLVVGMTGDGINDAPALKKADIGIAMGLRGTEAAKEAADLVLKDDQFVSITAAIRQGRGIFANIRHFVIYLLSCNLSELLIVSGAYLANLALPLLPLQILFMNMVTDVLPALALGMNKVDKNVMQRPPRGQGEPILTARSWRVVVLYALAMTLATLGIFLWSIYHLRLSDALANNLAFYTLILAQLWHVFNLPGRREGLFGNVVTRNPYVWLALAASVGLMFAAYMAPPIRQALHLQPLGWDLLRWVLLFSWMPVLIVQVFKRILRFN